MLVRPCGIAPKVIAPSSSVSRPAADLGVNRHPMRANLRIPLPGRRSSSSEGPDGLRIVIPARTSTFAVIFLLVWLIGWAFGEASATRQILSEKDPAGDLFLVVWLALWTIGGARAALGCLWMLQGYEVLFLRPGVLGVRREIFGVGRSAEYGVDAVKNLRVAPLESSLRRRRDPWGTSTGRIAFDYDAKTIRVGAGVDEAEAREIVADLSTRHRFGSSATLRAEA